MYLVSDFCDCCFNIQDCVLHNTHNNLLSDSYTNNDNSVSLHLFYFKIECNSVMEKHLAICLYEHIRKFCRILYSLLF
jgi:hypothetical protein